MNNDTKILLYQVRAFILGMLCGAIVGVPITMVIMWSFDLMGLF